MRRTLAWALAAGLVATVEGCATDAPNAPTGEVVDSAGMRIVTYDLTNAQPRTWRIVGEHDLEIGVRDGAPEYAFSRIPDLAVTDEGSIVVSDGAAGELRVYDASGVYRRTLGRQGEGPGEFAVAPVIVGLGGDTVFAFDGRNRRLTSLTTAGDVLEMVTLRSATVVGPSIMARQDDGTYLAQSPWVNPRTADELYEMRLDLDSIVIEHLDARGVLLDTVLVVADRNRARRVRQREDGTFSTIQAQPPFVAQAFVRSDGVRPVVARSDALELRLLGRPGESDLVIRVVGADHPATADDIRRRQEAAVREAAGGDEIDPMTWMLNVEFVPDRLPAFQDIVVSDEGDAWVALMEYDASEGYDWLVFSPAGELRGVVHTPPTLRLFEVRSDFIVGVVLDEFDVPFVRRYPLLFP